MEFELPEEAEMKASASINKDGKKVQKFGNISWYTNLDITKRHKDLELFRHYDPEDIRYMTTMTRLTLIKWLTSMDYAGVMGVPITFLSKRNPDQFDIFGMATGRSEFDPNHIQKKYLNPKQINKRWDHFEWRQNKHSGDVRFGLHSKGRLLHRGQRG